MSSDWRAINSVPRDGTIVELMADDDAGMSYEMLWNPAGTNAIVSTQPGIWECPGGGFTWCEDHGFGPTHWRPLRPEALP